MAWDDLGFCPSSLGRRCTKEDGRQSHLETNRGQSCRRGCRSYSHHLSIFLRTRPNPSRPNPTPAKITPDRLASGSIVANKPRCDLQSIYQPHIPYIYIYMCVCVSRHTLTYTRISCRHLVPRLWRSHSAGHPGTQTLNPLQPLHTPCWPEPSRLP